MILSCESVTCMLIKSQTERGRTVYFPPTLLVESWGSGLGIVYLIIIIKNNVTGVWLVLGQIGF